MAHVRFTLRKGEEKVGWSCDSKHTLDEAREAARGFHP
jgi:hypothetical protein